MKLLLTILFLVIARDTGDPNQCAAQYTFNCFECERIYPEGKKQDWCKKQAKQWYKDCRK